MLSLVPDLVISEVPLPSAAMPGVPRALFVASCAALCESWLLRMSARAVSVTLLSFPGNFGVSQSSCGGGPPPVVPRITLSPSSDTTRVTPSSQSTFLMVTLSYACLGLASAPPFAHLPAEEALSSPSGTSHVTFFLPLLPTYVTPPSASGLFWSQLPLSSCPARVPVLSNPGKLKATLPQTPLPGVVALSRIPPQTHVASPARPNYDTHCYYSNYLSY